MSFVCPGCRYPFCDADCASSPSHAGDAECNILARDPTPFSYTYRFVIIDSTIHLHC